MNPIFYIFILIDIIVIIFLAKLLKVKDKPIRVIFLIIAALILAFTPMIISSLNLGGTYGSRSSIGENMLDVEFVRSDRGWSTRMRLGESKKLSVSGNCESGVLTLTVGQGNESQDFDISDFEGELEFPDFEAGEFVRVQLSNEEARNASVLVQPVR